jgi:hypothetical protein
MFEKSYVQAALKKIHETITLNGKVHKSKEYHRDSIISLLVHDIFGGEILKTHQENDWYYYNRINGERLDFSATRVNNSHGEKYFEDLPSNPEEVNNYYALEDYPGLYIKFIHAYETVVGLEA